MEAVTSYETLVHIYQATRRHIPEDSNPDVSCLEKTSEAILMRFWVLTTVVMKSSVFWFITLASRVWFSEV
jgi:hypothetical protein